MGVIASRLLNRLFRRRSKKTSKLRVTGLCAGNSPETGEFPALRASNAENVSIWWRHHVKPSWQPQVSYQHMGPMNLVFWVNTALYFHSSFSVRVNYHPKMSPHILISLAAVLFAGMVQVKASDYNDCHAQQSFATILGDDSLISDECKEYLANLGPVSI